MKSSERLFHVVALQCELNILIEPDHDKTNKWGAPSEDSDQPDHPPILISLRCVRCV